nr:calcium-binding protein [Paraburkholderia sp. BL8N3]
MLGRYASPHNNQACVLWHRRRLCRVGIFVWVRWKERDVVAPLAQIAPLSGDKPTRVAIADWHYWHDQGRSF